METSERKRIAAALSSAKKDTIKEIIREAESYLGCQLTVGLAADGRAMTFAAILAAIVSFLIGGTASLIAANISIWPHIIPVIIIIFSLCIALFCAVHAARPTRFHYSGNDPKSWIPDVKSKQSLSRSLAAQASFYSRDISENAKVLDENHKCLRYALKWSLWGTGLSALIELILIIHHLLPFSKAA